MVETVERRIVLEGAVNFRDLGGYEAGSGRPRWRTLFRADGLGDLTQTDLSVLRGFGIRTVIDLRSGSELERGRFDVEAHPATFITSLSSTSSPTPRTSTADPGCSARSTSRSCANRREILAALEVAGLARRLAGRVPLHGGQGSHRRPLRHRPLAARRGRADRGGRHALSGEAMLRLRAKLIAKYPRAGRRSRTSTRSSRPTRHRWSSCSTISTSSTGRSVLTSRGWARRRTSSSACGGPCSNRRARPRRPGCPGASGRRRRPTPGRGA